jgi:hypothetical protein
MSLGAFQTMCRVKIEAETSQQYTSLANAMSVSKHRSQLFVSFMVCQT